MRELPFSAASESNKQAILTVLSTWLDSGDRVLEIGSGTGQHAVFFARQLPEVIWQTADQESYLWAIRARVQSANLSNLLMPLMLEATSFNWVDVTASHVFSANTAHIMPWSAVQAMFAGVAQIAGHPRLALYGPFNRNGEFTSESNRAFDASLRSQNPKMGLRDDTALIALAAGHGFMLEQDIAMPANNRLLLWGRTHQDKLHQKRAF